MADFVTTEKGLGPEGRIAVVRFDRGDGVTHDIRQAVVRWPTTPPVRNRSRTAITVSLQQPMGLPAG